MARKKKSPAAEVATEAPETPAAPAPEAPAPAAKPEVKETVQYKQIGHIAGSALYEVTIPGVGKALACKSMHVTLIK